jgi:phage shock protein C
MYCTRCGNQVEEAHRFCPQCGQQAGAAPRSGGAMRRLVRPMYDKRVAGVCAGFANYLEVDPTLVRIVWLSAALFTGVGFIAYIIAWIAMPKEYVPPPASAPQPAASYS